MVSHQPRASRSLSWARHASRVATSLGVVSRHHLGTNPVINTFSLAFDSATYDRPSSIAGLHPTAWESCDEEGRKARILFPGSKSDGSFTGSFVNSSTSSTTVTCTHSGKLSLINTSKNLCRVDTYEAICPSPIATSGGSGLAMLVPASGTDTTKLAIGIWNETYAGFVIFQSAPTSASGPPCPK